MTSTNNDPILVVVQLTGANDYMNTIVPYSDPLYYDNRPTVSIPSDRRCWSPIADRTPYPSSPPTDATGTPGRANARGSPLP